MNIKHILWFPFISLLWLNGCAIPSDVKPDPNKTHVRILDDYALNIDNISPIKINTASNKPWQNSHVFIENGDDVTIKAYGKWSPWPELLMWCGPEGNQYWMTQVPGINGAALMAKVGSQSEPFALGTETSFHASDYGMLFTAMNDSFEYQFNNEGEMNLDIYIQRNGRQGQKGKSVYRVHSYTYDDKRRRGSISVEIKKGDQFKARKWLLTKIGEIASSKNIAIKAGNEPTTGGSYQVLNEKSERSILTIDFEAVY